ncbi:MAG: TIM barrel protein [Pseudomonadota bacterium]
MVAANLGFLWKDEPVSSGIRAAMSAGYHGVELHWRNVEDLPSVLASLEETGGFVASLNTNKADGFGLSAIPGREGASRAAIDQSLELARKLDCGVVHVTAGVASGDDARDAYESALLYACETADDGTIIGIEPISDQVAPGYYLNSFDLAEEVIDDLDQPNLAMIYDFYHAHLMGLDVLEGYKKHCEKICSIQVCGLPSRGAPLSSEIDMMQHISDAGYDGVFGAEFHPDNSAWMDKLF